MTRRAKLNDHVHYVAYGTPVRPDGTQAYRSVCRSAIVTEVGGWVTTEVKEISEVDARVRVVTQTWDDDAAGVTVVNPTGLFLHPIAQGLCRYDALPPRGKILLGERSDYDGGTWHFSEECIHER